MAEARRRLKRQAIEYKGGECCVCGFRGHPAAYDFHHSDPAAKDFAIASGNYRSFAKVKAELDKTLLVCANCHRTIHGEQCDLEHARKREELRGLREAQPPMRGRRLQYKELPCAGCGAPKRVEITRESVTCRKECAAKFNEKIDWPSDTELSEMVWQGPVLQLARRLGVSEVSVKKRCRARGISTPPRGYWSKYSCVTQR